MREIKFRAWHLETKEMFYEGWNKRDGCELFRTKDDMFKYGEDAELMQYTGLKDRNGKEIYEGDIIFIDQHTIVVVRWGLDCWELILENNEPYIDDCLGNFNDLIEVIGNIYENKSLLKQ